MSADPSAAQGWSPKAVVAAAAAFWFVLVVPAAAWWEGKRQGARTRRVVPTLEPPERP